MKKRKKVKKKKIVKPSASAGRELTDEMLRDEASLQDLRDFAEGFFIPYADLRGLSARKQLAERIIEWRKNMMGVA